MALLQPMTSRTSLMPLNLAVLEENLCRHLCAEIRIRKRNDGILMLDTPFTFPDGDHFPIYFEETPSGSIRLSDRGHTMMHMSYEHDVDSFYDGTRAKLREQIVRDLKIQEDDGVFSAETSPAQLADTLFRLVQALTKICDLTFLSRERTISVFYEELKATLIKIVGEELLQRDFISPDIEDGDAYPVDYRIENGPRNNVFLYGVPNRDKARLTTIMLSHFLIQKLSFKSIIVFRDQQEIPRLDVARLTNVADTAVASLDAEEDLIRKIENVAA